MEDKEIGKFKEESEFYSRCLCLCWRPFTGQFNMKNMDYFMDIPYKCHCRKFYIKFINFIILKPFRLVDIPKSQYLVIMFLSMQSTRNSYL